MKKTKLLNYFLIVLTILVLIPPLKILSDSEDSSFDIFCRTDCLFDYLGLLIFIFSCGLIILWQKNGRISKQIILYLERQEKSPPVIS